MQKLHTLFLILNLLIWPFSFIEAPYDEPDIAVHYLCENIIISLSSHGFPKPVVSWFPPLGEENTTLTLDSTGRYRLQSDMMFNLNSTETVRVEMSLDVLSQNFSRTVTLHPHSGISQRYYVMPHYNVQWQCHSIHSQVFFIYVFYNNIILSAINKMTKNNPLLNAKKFINIII